MITQVGNERQMTYLTKQWRNTTQTRKLIYTLPAMPHMKNRCGNSTGRTLLTMDGR